VLQCGMNLSDAAESEGDARMYHLSLPELVAAADHHERQSRCFYRMAHSRTGAQRRSCLARAQHAASAAREYREWAGCG